MRPYATLLAMLAVGVVTAAGQTTSSRPAQTQTGQAQSPQAGKMTNNVCIVYFVNPKPGSEQQFEQSVKQHMQWHQQQNDDWIWTVSETIVGEMGSYVAASCGHSWSDFDAAAKKMEADKQDAMRTMGPHIGRIENSLYVYRADLSAPEQMGSSEEQQWPMFSIVAFRIKPGQTEAFVDAVTKVRSALLKTNTGARNAMWMQLVSGGQGPMFVLIRPLKGFSELPGTNVIDVLSASLGRQQAAQLVSAVADKAEAIYTGIDKARPDLGYRPSSQKQPR